MQLPMKPRRTALYLPASNARALMKARTLAADIVIIDLEDAVAPERKAEARAAAVAAVQAGGFGRREVIIRANGLDTCWAEDDLRAIAQSGADAVLVPKIGSAADIRQCDALLQDAPAGLALWAMIETCAAMLALGEIAGAAAQSRLAGFVLGTNDLAKEMRATLTQDRLPFLPLLTQAVVAARSQQLAILDGVCNDFQDLERFEAECRHGLALGFDGKTVIHPRQVEPCNRVFSPAADEVAWAERIIAAFEAPENAGKGAIQVDGQMVELLHLENARRTRAMAQAIAADSAEAGASA